MEIEALMVLVEGAEESIVSIVDLLELVGLRFQGINCLLLFRIRSSVDGGKITHALIKINGIVLAYVFRLRMAQVT